MLIELVVATRHLSKNGEVEDERVEKFNGAQAAGPHTKVWTNKDEKESPLKDSNARQSKR